MEKHLKKRRYIHSVGVAGTAASMAMKYGEDIFKAQVAGILHDCAKCYDDDELISQCFKNGIEVTEFERDHGFLLHAKYGAYMARTKYGIEDKEIQSAIFYHTTGKPGMTVLEKIIFVADYIEPARYKAPRLDKIRDSVFNDTDIDKALLMVMKDTIEYLRADEDSIDSTTLAAYKFYDSLLKGKIK